MAVKNLFASATLSEHIMRGAVGMSAYMVAGKLLALPHTASLVGAVALATASVFIMRGCPVCWTIGLLNTTRNQVCPISIKPSRSPNSDL